ncbi:hypothetical protein D3C81_2245810 [compost metagenome]
MIERLGIAAVPVSGQLALGVPVEEFAFLPGIRDASNAAFWVVLVLCFTAKRVFFP